MYKIPWHNSTIVFIGERVRNYEEGKKNTEKRLNLWIAEQSHGQVRKTWQQRCSDVNEDRNLKAKATDDMSLRTAQGQGQGQQRCWSKQVSHNRSCGNGEPCPVPKPWRITAKKAWQLKEFVCIWKEVNGMNTDEATYGPPQTDLLSWSLMLHQAYTVSFPTNESLLSHLVQEPPKNFHASLTVPQDVSLSYHMHQIIISQREHFINRFNDCYIFHCKCSVSVHTFSYCFFIVLCFIRTCIVFYFDVV